jgi:hypothetical protein
MAAIAGTLATKAGTPYSVTIWVLLAILSCVGVFALYMTFSPILGMWPIRKSQRGGKVTRVGGYKSKKDPILMDEPGWLSVNDPLTPFETPVNVPKDDPKRQIYVNLLHEGSALLRNLEQATERTSHSGLSPKDLNERIKWVNTYTMESLVWMAEAQRQMGLTTGSDVDVALFATHPTERTKPRYIENEPEMGVWMQLAGRVDWLRAELRS